MKTVEISDDTHRLLRQFAMMDESTPDKVAEMILSAFCRDVVVEAGRRLQEEVDALRNSS